MMMAGTGGLNPYDQYAALFCFDCVAYAPVAGEFSRRFQREHEAHQVHRTTVSSDTMIDILAKNDLVDAVHCKDCDLVCPSILKDPLLTFLHRHRFHEVVFATIEFTDEPETE